jgi:hypothetical protein
MGICRECILVCYFRQDGGCLQEVYFVCYIGQDGDCLQGFVNPVSYTLR